MESQLRPWLENSELARIDELIQAYGNTDPACVPALAAQFVRQSELLNDHNCVNLYAGTNIMDPQARLLTNNTIGSRPSLGQPGNKYEMGLEHAEALEVLCLALARRVFHCSYVEFRVFSGSMANLYAYMTLAKPGDTIEVTRWGMQPQHMSLIARAIADRLLARRSTSSIRAEIAEFRMQFQQLHFVLDTVS